MGCICARGIISKEAGQAEMSVQHEMLDLDSCNGIDSANAACKGYSGYVRHQEATHQWLDCALPTPGQSG